MMTQTFSLLGDNMKWFKHFSDASTNKKIQRLEGRIGLKGYAFYFKILELCAAQYDGISGDPIFVFNWVTLQNELRMKRKSISNVLRMTDELGFWKVEENEHEAIINFPKMLEYKHKDALSSKNRPAKGRKKARLDLEGDLKGDLDLDSEEFGEEKKQKNHPVQKFHNSLCSRHPDSGKFEDWVTEMELSSPKLKRESSTIMKAFDGFEKFQSWWRDLLPSLQKIQVAAEQKRYAACAIVNEAGIGKETA